MTVAETRLRQALQDAASLPAGSIDFDQLARRHHRQSVNRLVAASTLITAVVVSAIWVASGASTDAGKARLIPVATPTTSAAAPHVEAITRPIIVAANSARLDPAGPPPTNTAGYQRFLDADQGRALHGPVRVVYGKFSTFFNGHGHGMTGTTPGPGHAPNLRPGRAVWVIHQATAGTVYTVVNPVTAAWTVSWAIIKHAPFAVPDLPTTQPIPAPDLKAFERSGSTGPLLPAERRWGPNGRIIPAAPGTPTRISEATALSVAAGDAIGAGKTRHVELGYFTDDSYIGVGPDGKLSPDPKHRIIVNRLIWLVSYPDAPEVLYGPGPNHAGMHETLFVPVDATTGKAMFVFQDGDEERAPGAPPD